MTRDLNKEIEEAILEKAERKKKKINALQRSRYYKNKTYDQLADEIVDNISDLALEMPQPRDDLTKNQTKWMSSAMRPVKRQWADGTIQKYLADLKTINPENVGYVLVLMSLIAKPKPEKTPEALQERLLEYVEICFNTGIFPTNMVCYTALGLTAEEIMRAEKGECKDANFTKFIKDMKQFLSAARELAASNGKIPFPLAIWYDKIRDGESETTTLKIDKPSTFDNVESVDDLASKYLEATTSD